MALLLAPVSHKALVGTWAGSGFGGLLGSKAAVIETAVIIREAKPLCFIVKALKLGEGKIRCPLNLW